MSIFENVINIAELNKMTIKDVEIKSGLKPGTISKWKGSTPKVDNLYKVAVFFDVPMEYFLTGRIDNEYESTPRQNPLITRLITIFNECDIDGQDRIIALAVRESARSQEKSAV